MVLSIELHTGQVGQAFVTVAAEAAAEAVAEIASGPAVDMLVVLVGAQDTLVAFVAAFVVEMLWEGQDACGHLQEGLTV